MNAYAPPLAIRLLGPLRIERHGVAVTPPQYHRARALLAYLALEDRQHSREFLADLLWPSESVATGREHLRRMLFLLKESLTECQFEATRSEVRLCRGSDWSLDVADFLSIPDTLPVNEMARRVDNYQGHFLQGFSLDGSPAFEQWMETRRAEIQARFFNLALRLVERFDLSGDAARAIGLARRMVLLAPWSEAGWQTLIGLLVRAGRTDDARDELALCRSALHEELGVAPSPQTLALVPAEARRAERRPEQDDAAPERRQLTIVYCELAIPDEEDPDTLAERLIEPVRECEKLLRGAGAFVTHSAGGGLLGYFGYPVAREGDARRAALAALACRRIHGDGLQTRVGLHSAVVLSNATLGNPDTAGLATGLAIRVREAAGPGEAAMSENTRRLVAHACRFEARNRIKDGLSGRELDTFVLLKAAPGSPRWAGDTPLVGRARELAALEQAWRKVRSSGSGCLVLLVGEAGSGKTRLLREFAKRMADSGGAKPLVLDCFPELVDKPFHPFLPWLPGALGLQTDGDGSVDQSALAKRLAPLGLPGDATPVVASLLGAKSGDETTFRPWAAGKWQSLAIATLTALLDDCAREGTSIFVEDLHWSDLLSRDLFAALAAAPGGRFIVTTARPGFTPTWRDGEALRIELPYLGLDDSAALARAATDENALSPDMVKRIVAVGGGIPLYIEEVARQMADKAGLLPSTLHDAFQARVDAAGAELPLLRLAASMGALIDVGLLAMATARPYDDVLRIMRAFSDMGLVSPIGGGRFAFRHTLLRETAYHSQPRSARLAAHARIARALIERDAHAVERDPELLAWHYAHAGEPERAIDCLTVAGHRAGAHSVYREAVAHFQAALDLVATLPAGPARDQREMELRLAMGIPMLALHGNGSQLAGDTFRRTLALAESMGDDPRLFAVYWGLWLGSSSWEHFHTSRDFGLKLVHLATLGKGPNWLSHAHYALGNSLFCLGEFEAATRELEAGVACYCPDDADLSLGEDPLVTNLGFLAWSHWFTGRHDDALAASRRAIAWARELNQPYTIGYALIFAAILHRWRREVDETAQAASEALALGDRFGMALWQAAGTAIVGWAKAARGDQTGMTDIFGVVAMLGQVMGGIEAMFLDLLVDACFVANAPGPGLEAAERGLVVAEMRKDWHYLAEFQRMKGEFLARQGADKTEVDRWLALAAASAERYASPSLALRVAASQARRALADGTGTSARASLVKALSAFSSGEETGDIREARALLEAIPATH